MQITLVTKILLKRFSKIFLQNIEREFFFAVKNPARKISYSKIFAKNFSAL